MKVKKIVLTGGPCAGKTTAMQQIEKEFTEKGYRVIIVPEAATLLIQSGIRPFGEHGMDMVTFQNYVIDLQITLENLAERTAKEQNDPCLIVCDRGILDDKAYVNDKDWKQLLNTYHQTEWDWMNRYDLVIHLRTAAMGKEEFYTLGNNQARTESPEEARNMDQKTLEAWLGHEKLKVIGNETSFQAKIERVIREIYCSLEKPFPLQIQRKFLLSKMDLHSIKDINWICLDIEQYVKKEYDKELIYRKTSKQGETKYTQIIKIDTPIVNERITTSRNISKEEYEQNKFPSQHPIKKKRYCFEYQNQYFKLDIFADGLHILEVEPTRFNQMVTLPNFIYVIDEVTNNPEYRNSNLFAKQNQDQSDKSLILNLNKSLAPKKRN